MRYCRRTFFNVLFQPRRIGKHIKRITEQRYAYQKRSYMVDRRQSATPKMQLLARYQKVKYYKVFFINTRVKSPSKFVKRARYYATS